LTSGTGGPAAALGEPRPALLGLEPRWQRPRRGAAPGRLLPCPIIAALPRRRRARRDVLFLGDCDDGCRRLAGLLGWGEELEAMVEAAGCAAAGEGQERAAAAAEGMARAAAAGAEGNEASSASSSAGSAGSAGSAAGGAAGAAAKAAPPPAAGAGGGGAAAPEPPREP
jgi:hypothetical protein